MKSFYDMTIGLILSNIRTFFSVVLSTLIRISVLLLKLMFIFSPFYLMYLWRFQYSTELLEYIKTLIWPIFAFYFAHQYKKEIGILIVKITRIPTPWGQINTQQPADEGFTPDKEKKLEKESPTEKIDTKQAVESPEKHKQELVMVSTDKSGISEVETLKKALLEKERQIQSERDLGFDFYLKHKFEKAYRVIFGSQISILHTLELATDNLMSYDSVHKIYEASEFYPNYPFSAYINFLLSYGYIRFEGLSNAYSLSRLGSKFLSYLREEKLSFDKKPY